MAGTVEGERTAQGIGDTSISTGSKTFGASLPIGGNPIFTARNNLMMVAVVVVGLVAAFAFSRSRKVN